MVEKHKCVLSKLSTRLYIYQSTSAKVCTHSYICTLLADCILQSYETHLSPSDSSDLSYNMNLHPCIIIISNFSWLWAPSTSPYSVDQSLEVHCWFSFIIAANIRYSSFKCPFLYCRYYTLQVYRQTTSISAPKFIAKVTWSAPAVAPLIGYIYRLWPDQMYAYILTDWDW